MATKPQLQELGDFLNPVIGIPIGGKVYRVQAMTAQNALIIEKSMAGAKSEDGTLDPMKIQLETEDDGETYITRILGNTYQEMLDGGVPMQAIQHVVAMVTAWTFGGFEVAQEYFRSGGKVRPKPTDRKQKTGTPTRTGAASTTQPQS